MPKPLVSLITPCYNGEKVVHRMLDSVLSQTYPSIEFIFINDGSTDRTEEIFLSYASAFDKKGIQIEYIKQENQGIGGAINAGLKKFTGDYLCWTDADDALEPMSIEKRVCILENNVNYGCVTSDAYLIRDENSRMGDALLSKSYPHSYDNDQFLHLLLSESIFCAGCHMIRTNAFLDVNPLKEIYPAKRGQNWQMLLPVYYKFKRYFLDEPLYKYYVSHDSMSNDDDTSAKRIERFNEHIDILINTLERIDMPDSKRGLYKSLVIAHYARRKLNIAYKIGDRKMLIEQYEVIKRYDKPTIRDQLKYIMSNVALKR